MKAARVVVVALAAFFCAPVVNAASAHTSCTFGGPCARTVSQSPALTSSGYTYWGRDAAGSGESNGQCTTFTLEQSTNSNGGTPGTTIWRAYANGGSYYCGTVQVRHCEQSPGRYFEINGSGGACVTGDAPASACEMGWSPDPNGPGCIPPPPLDCGREAGKVVRAKLGSANTQNWCFPTGQTIDPNGDITPDNFVTGSCQGVVDPSGTLVTDVASGEMVGSFKLTGQPCSDPNPDVPEPTVDEPEAPEEVCVTGSSGTKACVSKDTPANCGEFNGQKICVDSPPPGNCTFFGSGNWVCDSNAPTPPKPADPPGSTTPAQPEFQQSGRGPTGQPSTVNIYPPGVEGGDSGSTYTPPDTGGAGVGDGQGDAACGGEGQPPCKIDEDGTPTFEDSEIGDATGALDGTLSDAEGAGDSAPFGDGSTVASGARGGITGALPAGGDCGPIVWTLPFGNEVTIDLYDKCGPFRAAMAWVLGLFTAWYLIQLAFRAPVGG